jgi:hypothetical protein
MQVLPVGISASTLSVFWPLWDAALLRRYGRARPAFCDNLAAALVAAWLRSHRPAARRTLCYAATGYRLPPPGEAPLLREQAAPPLEEAPPPLELHWPSDRPQEPPRIIVVERWLPQPSPMTGDLLDVLY